MIVVIEGILCTSLVLLVEQLGEIIPLATRLSGMAYGPLVGLFTLGVLFPKINAKVLLNSSSTIIFLSFLERFLWSHLRINFYCRHSSTH
jgi:sodium-coupled monocarboxylate transporter 8/12